MYLLHCQIYNRKCVGKCETTFNIRLNNQIKYANPEKSILACKYFNEPYYNFQQHAKFKTNIDINKTNINKTNFKTNRFIPRWITSGREL